MLYKAHYSTNPSKYKCVSNEPNNMAQNQYKWTDYARMLMFLLLIPAMALKPLLGLLGFIVGLFIIDSIDDD